MEKVSFKGIYPVFTTKLDKTSGRFASADDAVAYLKEKVTADPEATFIALFDHYRHTSALPNGYIDPAFTDAKNIVFCFGRRLESPEQAALRPLSLSVVETAETVIVSFLEPPNPKALESMTAWVTGME